MLISERLELEAKKPKLTFEDLFRNNINRAHDRACFIMVIEALNINTRFINDYGYYIDSISRDQTFLNNNRR